MNAIDTNIFAYAFDASDPVRGLTAETLLERLSNENSVLLWQVACELGAVLSKLLRRGTSSVDPLHGVRIVRARFPLLLPEHGIFDIAADLQRDFQFSYWDGLLVAACLNGGVKGLYTEDLPGLKSINGLEFVSPFN
jgi:predicted nucleic acid-binding protein